MHICLPALTPATSTTTLHTPLRLHPTPYTQHPTPFTPAVFPSRCISIVIYCLQPALSATPSVAGIQHPCTTGPPPCFHTCTALSPTEGWPASPTPAPNTSAYALVIAPQTKCHVCPIHLAPQRTNHHALTPAPAYYLITLARERRY